MIRPWWMSSDRYGIGWEYFANVNENDRNKTRLENQRYPVNLNTETESLCWDPVGHPPGMYFPTAFNYATFRQDCSSSAVRSTA